jgi:hypothetical protein
MAYNTSRIFNRMEIIETTISTRQIQELLKDEEYRRLQLALLSKPDLGAVIPAAVGCAKSVGRGRDTEKEALFE